MKISTKSSWWSRLVTVPGVGGAVVGIVTFPVVGNTLLDALPGRVVAEGCGTEAVLLWVGLNVVLRDVEVKVVVTWLGVKYVELWWTLGDGLGGATVWFPGSSNKKLKRIQSTYCSCHWKSLKAWEKAHLPGFKITFSKLAQICQLFSKTKISTYYFVEIDWKYCTKSSLQWPGYCRL